MAGETRRSKSRALDPENLSVAQRRCVAERKCHAGPFVRRLRRATGLLRLQGLEEAIERIRAAHELAMRNGRVFGNAGGGQIDAGPAAGQR